MRPFLILLLLLAATPGLPAAEAEEGRAPSITRLERGRWDPADAIVEARIESVRDARAPGGALGRQVVRARVAKSWKGPLAAEQVFTLVVYGQRPTLDPARPSVPYFHDGKASEHILFLGRGAEAHAWRLQTLFDLDGDHGAEQAEAVATLASWRAMHDVTAKGKRVVQDLLRMLARGGEWTRTYAARELAWMAETRPQAFDAKARRTLQRLGPTGANRDQRFWARRALACLVPGRGDAAETPAETDPWRRAFLEAEDREARIKVLTRLHASGGTLFDTNAWWAWRRLEPSLRAWFLDSLIESKRAGMGPALRRAYGVEDDPETRESLVRALGFLGSSADVPWLVARTGNERLRRPALLALSRIGTPEARAALAEARKARWADEDLQAWIDYLRGALKGEPSDRSGG